MYEQGGVLATYFLVGANFVFWLILAIMLVKRIYLVLAIAPLLVSMVLRVQSVFYIDLFGPVYSSQLFSILGPGIDSIYIIICYAVFLVPFLLILEFFVFRYPWYLNVKAATYSSQNVENLFYLFLFLFFTVLYAQLFMGGVIPLIDHIERFDFSDNHAGPLHDYMFKYGAIFTLVLGGQTVYSKLSTGRYDRRAFVFLCLIILYAVLTGHRFAAFNKFISFYLIPFSLIFAREFHLKRQGLLQHNGKQERRAIFGIVIIGFSVALFSIVNSYSNVRTVSDETVFSRIVERLFIQQGELWVEATNRVRQSKNEKLTTAMDYLFFKPIIPGKNTSIQYLMWLSLGSEATRVLDIGQQYAGGFPEIFLEVFGIYLFLPVLLLFGIVMAMVTAIFLASLRKGKLLSMLMAGFIMYAAVLTVYNGMLNQYFVLTFWMKMALLLIFYRIPSIRMSKLFLFWPQSK